MKDYAIHLINMDKLMIAYRKAVLKHDYSLSKQIAADMHSEIYGLTDFAIQNEIKSEIKSRRIA